MPLSSAWEPRDHRLGIAQPEHRDDVRAHALGRRGGEGGKGRAHGQGIDELGDLQVGGAEVLPPLRDAVRLVDCDQRDADAARRGRRLREGDEARVGQALGRHVHDLVPALRRALEHGVLLSGRERRVEVAGTGAGGLEGADLVAHERDERAHHQGDPGQGERGDLVADGFPRSGGHDAQRVPAGQDRPHQTVLPRPEGVVAEVPAQRLVGRAHQVPIHRHPFAPFVSCVWIIRHREGAPRRCGIDRRKGAPRRCGIDPAGL